jgi:uncharacterized lipoprotein YddW (UPF0748 family)
MPRRAWRGLLLCAWLAAAASAQPVVLVRDGDAEQSARISQVSRAVQRAGLPMEAVADAELAALDTTGVKLAVLPDNPNLSAAALDWLRRLLAGGGHLMVFPPAPSALAAELGLADVGAMTNASDDARGPIELVRERVEALPALWPQRSWSYQPVTALSDSCIVGAWHDGATAVVMTHQGAFIDAVPSGDDRAAEAQVVLAVAVTYAPELWHVCLPRLLAEAGRAGDLGSLGELRQRLTTVALPPERRAQAEASVSAAEADLRQAAALYDTGRKQSADPHTSTTAAERYLPSARLAWEATGLAERAYCLAQEDRPDEFRGAWIQDAGGIRGWGWPRTAAALAANNVSAVFVNVANGGYANYPSAFLPHVAAEGEDPLSAALAACHGYGIQVHAWIMANDLRPLTPPWWRERLEADGRLQRDAAGRALGSLRPADARNRQLLAEVAGEIASRYAVDGVHLDYVRFAGADAGYGPEDRDAFERDSAQSVDHWPACVAERGPRRAAWLEWREKQVNAEMEGIAGAVRAARPGARLSAAVWPIWVDAANEVGQQPELWAQAGWVDFLCPMDYQTIDASFLRYFTLQQRLVGAKVPLYPGLAAWRHESPADTVAQIDLVRRLGGSGYVLFHLDRRLAEDWLPALHLGLAASRPAGGVAALLGAARDRHGEM